MARSKLYLKYKFVDDNTKFIADLKNLCGGLAVIGHKCRVTTEQARQILVGEASQELYTHAKDAFYNTDTVESMQLELIFNSKGRTEFTRMLSYVAKTVHALRGGLNIPESATRFWVFPPRSLLVELNKLHERLWRMLALVHALYPRLDGNIYKGCWEVRNGIRNGIGYNNWNKLPEVQSTGKKRTGGRKKKKVAVSADT